MVVAAQPPVDVCIDAIRPARCAGSYLAGPARLTRTGPAPAPSHHRQGIRHSLKSVLIFLRTVCKCIRLGLCLKTGWSVFANARPRSGCCQLPVQDRKSPKKKRVEMRFLSAFVCLYSVFSAAFVAECRAAGSLSDAAKEQICVEATTLFRAARAVISGNQDLINDATKGDKGLSGDTVVQAAKENYLKVTGNALPDSDGAADDSLTERARSAMLASISEVMEENQDWINEKGKGFKGFLPAVFAKMVADRFSDKMSGQMFVKLTAPKQYVRNRANRPDSWEHKVIEEMFKSAEYENGKPFSEHAARKGRDGFRLIIPEYYKESCLKCHGSPKGARDIIGGKREGGKLGELGGAISVGIYD